MNKLAKLFAGFAVVAIAVPVVATSPGASSEHFVVTNNYVVPGSNTATVLEPSMPPNPTLSITTTLDTHSNSRGLGGLPTIQMVQHGADTCLFIGNGAAGNISAFTYPGWASAGSYSDPELSNTALGVVLAANPTYLFAGYTARNANNGHIGVWSIGTGCTLSLVGTYAAAGQVLTIAASPNGKMIAITYPSNGVVHSAVDSFSVSANGALTEHGPYNEENYFLYADSVDITADSKYALFGEVGYGNVNGSPETQVGVFPINSDGSLGPDHDFGGTGALGQGYGVEAVRLSPDERFLFVSDADSGSQQITTLDFNESTPSVSYACITTRRNNGNVISLGQMATSKPVGSGENLYVAESGIPGYVALFAIDSSSGCTTEVPGSPFSVGQSARALQSITAWPPRPF